MPRKATGQIDQVGDKWRARLRGVYLGLFDTEQDAKDAVQDALGLEKEPESCTFQTRAVEWFKARELSGEIEKIEKQQSDWNHRVLKLAKFIDWEVRRIRTQHIQAWLAILAKQPAYQVINRKDKAGKWVPEYRDTGNTLSRESVGKALSLVKLFLDWCIREGDIESNPARMAQNPVRKRPSRKGTQRIIHPTQAEITALFALDMPDLVRAVLALAIYAGLRRAEIWGLRWEHVDLDGERLVRVRFSYDGDCKSETSVREVPLFPFARKALKAYWHTLSPRPITGYVFPADGGGCHSDNYDCGWSDHKGYRHGPRVKDKTQRVWPGWRTKAGIRREVTFRTLRHATGVHTLSGTFLGNAVPFTLKQVSAMLGHSSEKVTERHYAYLLPGNIHEAAHGSKKEIEKGKVK
jgi:integrase